MASIMGRAKAAAANTATPPPGPCDVCKATDTETHVIPDGVRICVAQAPCIARTKTAGKWMAP